MAPTAPKSISAGDLLQIPLGDFIPGFQRGTLHLGTWKASDGRGREKETT